MIELCYSVNQITVYDVVKVVKCAKDYNPTIQEIVDIDNAIALLKKYKGSFSMKYPLEITLEREDDFIILSI